MAADKSRAAKRDPVSFYHNQLAQRAEWAAQDYKRYLKAKFFLKHGSPNSIHVPKNMETVQFLSRHYSWNGDENVD